MNIIGSYHLFLVFTLSIVVNAFRVFPVIPKALSASSSVTPFRHQQKLQMAAAEFNWAKTEEELKTKMKKCLDSVQTNFAALRPNQVNPSMVDKVSLEADGKLTPLSQIARISGSGQTLQIEPYDRGMFKDIEKALIKCPQLKDLTPNNDGTTIYINLPPLTEERRKEYVKIAKGMAEEGKVALRNIRRDFVDKVKSGEKAKSLSKDSSKTYQEDIQKVTDEYTKKIDTLAKTKEKDLLKV
jgi:ribosome recycling factor